MLLPIDGSEAAGWRPGTPTTFLTGHSDVAPAFSPDGRWMAYASNASGPNQIYVQPFPGPGGKWLISTDGGTFPVWSRAHQELLYAGADNRIMMVSVHPDGRFVQCEQAATVGGHAVSPAVPRVRQRRRETVRPSPGRRTGGDGSRS